MKYASAICAVLCLGATLIAPPAHASSSERATLDEAGEQELTQFLNEHDVPQGDQEHLLQKLEDGEPWDSLSEGSDPVEVDTVTIGGVEQTVEYYEDGSVSSTTVDQPEEDAGETVNPLLGGSVSNCSISGKTATGCYASQDHGVIQKGFHFDSHDGRITRAYGTQHRFIGGTLSNHRLDYMASNRVRYSSDVSVAFQGFPLGWTAWMEVSIINGRAVINHN